MLHKVEFSEINDKSGSLCIVQAIHGTRAKRHHDKYKEMTSGMYLPGMLYSHGPKCIIKGIKRNMAMLRREFFGKQGS